MSAITTQIKKQRSARGLTQDQMAERLHLSTKAYQKIENGITKLDIERLNQIAEILEISLVDLINSDENIYIHSISENEIGFNNKEVVINKGVSEDEKEVYQQLITTKDQLIASKDKEIQLLRDLLNKYEKDGGTR